MTHLGMLPANKSSTALDLRQNPGRPDTPLTNIAWMRDHIEDMIQRELVASINSRLTAFIMDPTTSLNDLRAARDRLREENDKIASALGWVGKGAGFLDKTGISKVLLSLIYDAGWRELQDAIDLLTAVIKEREKQEKSRHLMEKDAWESSGDQFDYPFPQEARSN